MKNIQPFKKEFWQALYHRRLSMLSCCIVIIVIIWSNFSYKFWNDKGCIIANDVISSYQYLPALFIYHDLSLKFIEGKPEYFSDKIWANKMENGRYLGRMTMGLSVMYAPFFLVAHAMTIPLGYEADGYSPPYKLALIFSSVFYLCLGLILLRSVLKRYFPDHIAALVIIMTVLGTNLFFYSVLNPAMSHTYSFCLFAAFIFFMIRWLDRPSTQRAIPVGLLAGIIALVRPVNLIIVMLIHFWEVDSIEKFRQRLLLLSGKWYHLILMIFMAFLLILPQLFYWKCVTGHYLYYGFEGERFFFNNPQFFRGIFSYKKGWLVYTPMMLFAMAGMIILAVKRRGLFIPVFLFMLVNMYIIFSWWCWYAGGSFGMRFLIESYVLLAFPMASCVQWVFERKWYYKVIAAVTILFFLFLNFFQTAQYNNGAISYSGMTKQAYWETFFKLKPTGRFFNLVREYDLNKAMNGIYEEVPSLFQNREEFIKNTEKYIRSDKNWMKQINQKAEKMGQPIDSVIHWDAIWCWERIQEKENKPQ